MKNSLKLSLQLFLGFFFLHGAQAKTADSCPDAVSAWLACEAFFGYELVGTDELLLWDLSTGTFDSLEWTVNGTEVIGQDPLLAYFQTEEGLYTICLDIWSADGGCADSFCTTLFIGDPANLCNYTDCVWPGDANGNGFANNYDLLNIGLAFDAVGTVRPDAHTNWIGQYAPDWGTATVNGVDYKHVDCDGDGIIDEMDIQAIYQNYNAELPENQPPVQGAPEVWLEFNSDTLIIDDDSPEEMLIIADLMVATADNPVIDLHGLACALSFPQFGSVFVESVFVLYNENSFFGAPQEVLWLNQTDEGMESTDLAFSRKSGSTISGNGKIATVGFIVISDIIGSRSENEILFDVKLDGLRMVDGEGHQLDIGKPDQQSGVVIINNFLTAGNIEALEAPLFELAPNPVSDILQVKLAPKEVGWLSIYDIHGQQKYRLWADRTTLVPVADWPKGAYFITFEGTNKKYSRKFFIQ